MPSEVAPTAAQAGGETSAHPGLAVPPVSPLVPLLVGLFGAFIGSVILGPLLMSTPVTAIPTLLFGVGLAFSGALLAREGRMSSAHLFLAASVVWPLGWVDAWGGGMLPVIGLFCGPMAIVLVAAALYGYPDPRQVSRAERVFLRVLATWIVVGRTLVILTGRPEWVHSQSDAWWPNPFVDPALFSVVNLARTAGETGLSAIFVVLWLRRTNRMTGLERRLAQPVAVAGVICGIAAAASPLALALHMPWHVRVLVYAIQAAMFLAAPAAVVFAVVRSRLTMGGVAALVRDFSKGVTPRRVEDVLRRTLADPGLRVVFWSRSRHRYVDAEGDPVPDPPPPPAPGAPLTSRQAAIPVLSSSGKPLAVILTRGVPGTEDLMASTVAASAIALENAQLQADLKAQLAEVKSAQLRITEAGVRERQQMERDLHDGAQQQLLSVKMTLAAAEAKAASPDLVELIGRAKAQVGETLEELRDLARGLHPPLLSQAGLAAAVSAITESLPISTTVDLPAERFPAATETTAYFVISEGLANVVRHSGAGHVTIIGRRKDGRLVVTISDDGLGGADAERGSGLTGLGDRVRALGGSMRVYSPVGSGTVMWLEVPCG